MKKTRKELAWTSIRSRRCSRNALLHFLKKLEISSKSYQFQLPFSLLFCMIFEFFPETSKERSRVGPQSHKNTAKWTPVAPKRSPRINKLNPKAPLRTKSMQNCPRRVAKWSRKCCRGVPRPPQMQEKHKKMSKVIIRYENGPQSLENTQEHIDTNSQPTKQGHKWRHESANNQTNEQTPTYTFY